MHGLTARHGGSKEAFAWLHIACITIRRHKPDGGCHLRSHAGRTHGNIQDAAQS